MSGRINGDAARAALRDWQVNMRTCETALGEFTHITGAAPDSPLLSAVYAAMGMATRRSAECIGCSVEWLEAWWLEHSFGATPMRAGLKGEPLREISTIDALADLIIGDVAEK